MHKAVRLTLIIIIAVLIPVVPFLVVGELPGERWLSEADDNALLFAATGTGLLALDIALPIPSSLVGTALGARLGFWAGSIWCWLGLMIGNMVGYGFGHLFPRRFVTLLPLEPSQAIVFLSRPVPVFAEVITMTAELDCRPICRPNLPNAYTVGFANSTPTEQSWRFRGGRSASSGLSRSLSFPVGH